MDFFKNVLSQLTVGVILAAGGFLLTQAMSPEAAIEVSVRSIDVPNPLSDDFRKKIGTVRQLFPDLSGQIDELALPSSLLRVSVVQITNVSELRSKEIELTTRDAIVLASGLEVTSHSRVRNVKISSLNPTQVFSVVMVSTGYLYQDVHPIEVLHDGRKVRIIDDAQLTKWLPDVMKRYPSAAVWLGGIAGVSAIFCLIALISNIVATVSVRFHAYLLSPSTVSQLLIVLDYIEREQPEKMKAAKDRLRMP